MSQGASWLRWTLIFGAITLGSACRPAAPNEAAVPTSSANRVLPALDGTPDSNTPGARQPVWDLIFMNRQPVGHQSLVMFQQNDAQASSQVAISTTELSVQRFGQSTHETMQMASREAIDGQLLRVESNISSGTGELRTIGRRQGDLVEFETRAGDTTRKWTLSLPANCGGYFAVEWSLKRQPLATGERRQLTAVVPVLNQVAEITLQSGPYERVELLGESVQLRRIDQQLELPGGQRIDSVLWADEQGEVLKSETPSLHQVSFRVDRETALAAMRRPSFDLSAFSTVRVDRPLEDANATRLVRYRVQLSQGNPAASFLQTGSQSVAPIGPHTADVTVRALRPGDRVEFDDVPPGPSETGPSAMIQSDASEVLGLASQVHALATDAWSIAVATERFVFTTLTRKDFSTAFATAADVARHRQGDCTEHAVLTAALCRAQGVPARVLIGLVYVGSQQGFAFHMWNEVWIDGQWIPIDGTLGQGGIPATHIALSRSSLETNDTFSALLPVIEVMGQLDIQIMDVQHQISSQQ
jgi:hypothetical protein